MLWTQATVVNNSCCHKQRKPIIALSVICRHVSNVWHCPECRKPSLHRQTSLICSLPSTTTMRREEVSRMLDIIRPLPELGSNKETELWVETVAWTVGGGGDCSAETGGDWGWEDARPAAGGGPASATPGTYLNLLMAARLSVKSVAFRHTGTIISCVIPSWENC